MVRWYGMFLAFAFSALAAAAEPPIQSFEGKAQGSSYHVRYAGPLQSTVAKDVELLLADFDRSYSNYRKDSDISRFNAAPVQQWITVPAGLASLIQTALRISQQHQGTFDVTIGAILKEWGFGPYKKAEPTVPTAAAIQVARAHSGFKLLEVRLQPPALRKAKMGVEVDLSGIAQGYAVDQVAALLDSKGITSYMVEVGGELVAKGEKAPGVDWIVAIEAPQKEPGSTAVLISPRGRGLATSGDYRDYFEKAGKRYCHILDPRVGRPVEHALASVSVLAPTVAEADAYAKVFMVLGPEAGESLALALKMPVFFIVRKGGGFEAKAIAGFDQYIVSDQKQKK